MTFDYHESKTFPLQSVYVKITIISVSQGAEVMCCLTPFPLRIEIEVFWYEDLSNKAEVLSW